MFKIVILIIVVIIGFLIFRLPHFFPDTFTHDNPYEDDGEDYGGFFD